MENINNSVKAALLPAHSNQNCQLKKVKASSAKNIRQYSTTIMMLSITNLPTPREFIEIPRSSTESRGTNHSNRNGCRKPSNVIVPAANPGVFENTSTQSPNAKQLTRIAQRGKFRRNVMAK